MASSMKRVNTAPDDLDSFDEFGPNHEKHRIVLVLDLELPR